LPASEITDDHHDVVDQLEAAIREAGELALRSFKSPVRSWLKSGNSPVSEVDVAVDRLLRERLLAIAPECAWLSEETEDDHSRLTAERVWIVDPIDGTRAFLAGFRDWTISIALARRGRPVLAAVFAPVTEEMFVAVAGRGATCNHHPIRVSAGGSAPARVAGPQRYLKSLAEILPQYSPVPKVHSLALRITRVAQGTLDIAFASSASHDWDLAAADLLVHEAGGALTTLAGGILAYNRPEPTHEALVAAGLSRHRQLTELIRGRDNFR
jgi:myo-inositol-1(or 4)-monophosphatase